MVRDQIEAKLTALMWAFFAKLGIEDKMLALARGETVTFDTYGLLTGHKRFALNLEMFGKGHLAQPGADRGQVGFQTVLAVVSVFVLAMVAVVVADNLDSSIGTPSNTALSTAQNDIITGFGDMASLIGTLFIIAIVVVIIFQIRRVN